MGGMRTGTTCAGCHPQIYQNTVVDAGHCNSPGPASWETNWERKYRPHHKEMPRRSWRWADVRQRRRHPECSSGSDSLQKHGHEQSAVPATAASPASTRHAFNRLSLCLEAQHLPYYAPRVLSHGFGGFGSRRVARLLGSGASPGNYDADAPTWLYVGEHRSPATTHASGLSPRPPPRSACRPASREPDRANEMTGLPDRHSRTKPAGT